jgi:hypothetical protein
MDQDKQLAVRNINRREMEWGAAVLDAGDILQ